MKVLDKYLIRELLYPIFYLTCSLIVLVLIADVFDNLDEFIRNKTPGKIVFKYYLSLVPYAFVQVVPWAIWLGTLFQLVHFGFHNELLAMKVSGLKIAHIIRPILFLGFLFGIIIFVISDRLLPVSYRVSEQLSETYIQKRADPSEGKVLHNLAYHSPEYHLFYFRTLSMGNFHADHPIILWLDPVTGKTKQKVSASQAVWNGQSWTLEDVTEYQIDGRGRVLGEPRTFKSKNYFDLTASPADIIAASSDSIFLSYRQMKKAMKQLKQTGADIRPELVDLQNRLSTPWQGLLMMLITIPILGPTRNRKGIAMAVLACVGFVFAYQLTLAVGLALGKSGYLTPTIGAWLGNFSFAVLALLNLDRANF